MDIEQLILIGLITVNTIVAVIASLTGNKDLATKAEQKREKNIAKLQKKHKKTEQKFIKEEKELQNAANTKKE